MNKIYKVFWSKTKKCYVAVSEIAKRSRKCKSSTLLHKILGISLLVTGVVTAALSKDAGAAAYLNGARIAGAGNAVISPDIAATAWGNGQVTGTKWRATAFGHYAEASGENSLAFGYYTKAMAENATAFGKKSEAKANQSTAFGAETVASGYRSTAWGNKTAAAANDATAWGDSTQARGNSSTAFGTQTIAGGKLTYNGGEVSLLVKRAIERTDGTVKDAWVFLDTAGNAITGNPVDSNISAKDGEMYALSYVEALAALTVEKGGNNAVAFGEQTIATAANSTALGFRTIATADTAIAFGHETQATAKRATAFGINTRASGANSTSFGYLTQALGENATAFGSNTVAVGGGATAFGAYTEARAENSVAWGHHTLVHGGKAIINNVEYTDLETLRYSGTNRYYLIGRDRSGNIVRLGGEAEDTEVIEGGFTYISGAEDAWEGVDEKAREKVDAWIVSINGGKGEVAGQYSTAFGEGSEVYARNALGGLGGTVESGAHNAIALGQAAIIGKNATDAIALGNGATVAANKTHNIAIGKEATASGGTDSDGDGVNDSYAVAIGQGAVAGGDNSVAIGQATGVSGQMTATTASGKYSVAIGQGVAAEGERSIAIGYGNKVSGEGSGAFGDPNIVTGNGSYVFGNNNVVDKDQTFVLGSHVTTELGDSVYLGNGSAAAQDDATPGTAGLNPTGSTKGEAAYTSETINGKTYVYAGGENVAGVVAIGSASQTRRIQNVAPGLVSADSTDVVNGSQLYEVIDKSILETDNHAVGLTVNAANRQEIISPYIHIQGIEDATKDSGKTGYAQAVGTDAIAIGKYSNAQGTAATAIGKNSNAQGDGSLAIQNATARGKDSVAFGNSSQTASGAEKATAFGYGATANAESSTAFGDSSTTASGAARATAFGYGAMAAGVNSFAAQGAKTAQDAKDAIAIGDNANAGAENTVVLGKGAAANHKDSVALGSGSQTTLGATVENEQVGSIIFGEFAGQLNDTNKVVSVGAAGAERQIQNVAAGRVTDTSTDAVNGSQLYAAYNQLQWKIGTAEAGGSESAHLDASVVGKPDNGTDKSNVLFKAGSGIDIAGESVDGGYGITIKIDKADAPAIAGGTITGGSSNKYWDSKQTQDAINTAYWTVTSSTASGSAAQPVKAGDTVDLKAGNGVKIDQSGKEFTFTVDDDTLARGTHPLRFKGDNTTVTLMPEHGDTVTVKGGAPASSVLTEGNIGVTGTAEDNTLTVKLVENVNLGKDGSVVIGDTKINNDGLTVNGGPTILKTGIDASNTRIINVADGVEENDAVNLRQLNNRTAGLGWVVGDKDKNPVGDKISDGKQVNFVSGVGTVSEVTQDTEGTYIRFHIDKADAPAVVQNNGRIAAGTADKYWDSAQVSTAINSAYWKAVGGEGVIGGDTANIAAGNSMTVKAGTGIKIEQKTTEGIGTEFTFSVNAPEVDALTFVGDEGEGRPKHGARVSVEGGADTGALTDGNIGVVASQDGDNAKLTVKLAKDIKDIDSVAVSKEIRVGNSTSVTGDTVTTGTVTADTVKAGDTTVNNEGVTIAGGPSVTKTGIDAGKMKITNVADGTDDSDAVNLAQLKAATAGISKVKVAAGSDQINVQTTTEGNETTYTVDLDEEAKVALNKVETDGLRFAGDSGMTDKIGLGKQLAVKGDTNITTSANGGQIDIRLNNKLDLGDNGSLTVGGTVINNDGITATSLRAGGTTVSDKGVTVEGGPSMTKAGIDGGGQTVTNVGSGIVNGDETDDTNAATIGDLKQMAGNPEAIRELGGQVSRLGDRINKVGAGAAALAALHPMDFDPDDKLTFAAGVGNYRGQNAGAVGMFYRPDEKVMFSMGGTVGNGENMVNAGVSFSLDRVNRVTNSKTAMAKEIVDLRSLVVQMAARMDRMEAAKGGQTEMFPDVPENHWAYEFVEDLQKRGIVEGYPDGNFTGNRSMTRYEFAAMLDRAVRKGVILDKKLAEEFEPELGRIYVERISGKDSDRHKIERIRVNDKDTERRDVYGSEMPDASGQM